MENQKISDLVRDTAKNIYTLLLQLADHIDELEKENSELKSKDEK
jgi:hypothetical protein